MPLGKTYQDQIQTKLDRIESQEAGGPCRESVTSIVSRQVEQLTRELAGWRYLQVAMEHLPTDRPQEEALYEILTRARRERNLY